ncbi:hypothetical protein CFOL_v3_10979 [Cephalotus follicularis]|uniref:Rve domain-containing protein n=1 Tax=Cephalotus follicularis TaxID=3775 RepID=A0A1Q3BHX0_CEPFO|nr:hypothetical protein CFOL_v3_10979 [Cephalotus follicularis]
MILVEIWVHSPRVVHFNEANNEDGSMNLLDLVEELRDKATIRVAAYQQRVSRYYNKRVNPRPLKEGDLILHNAVIADPIGTRGTLAPNWVGPYKVRRVLRPRTFKLETLGGREIPRAWNVENLRSIINDCFRYVKMFKIQEYQ